MRDLPTGTVTFLLTDIEGSTKLWERDPEPMSNALRRHDELASEIVERRDGRIIRSKGEGDSLFAVFARASDAVAATADLQRAFHAESWPEPASLRVRMAVHTGEAELRDGDYYGTAVNRCARIRAMAHGGQALLSQSTWELTQDHLPADVSLKDVGIHRLKDLSRAERIYQINHPDLPDDFPPLKSLDVQPNNLPQQLTSFVGRERELAEIRKLLRNVRLLTLTGAGGCGKTRLALQAAADAVDEYSDGVWLVELDSLSDPGLVTREVSRAVKVRDEPGRSVIETLVEHLGSRRILLLMDNCEHMVTASAQLTEALLKSCAGLTVLATSREALNIPGETVFPLAPLSLPDPRRSATVENLSQYESVQLFIDRAVSVLPSFAVDNANAPAVAHICHRLDGIPLAIELAAARIRSMPVEQIAARIEDRFRLLTGGKRTALPRRQTLKALTEWSYELLSEPEKTLFRRLAIFAGGWTLDGAEAVCSGGHVEDFGVMDLLAGLADKSLVVYEADGATDRYRMLETIRQFAGEALEDSDEREQVQRRHFEFVLDFVARADPDEPLSRQKLGAEVQNILAAHRTCDQVPDGASLGLRLVAELSRFFGRQGDFGLELRLTVEALGRPGADGRTSDRAAALRAAAWAAYRQGKYELARSYTAELLEITEDIADPKRVVDALRLKAAAAQALGAVDEAHAALHRAHELCRQLPDERARFAVAIALGEFHRGHGELEAAAVPYREALDISRRRLTPFNTSVALANLVYVLPPQEGAPMLLEAFEFAGKAASPRLDVALVDLAANVAGESDQWDLSARLRGAAEAEMERMAMRRDFADERSAEPVVERAKKALGSQGYETAYLSGRDLPFEEASAVARGWLQGRPAGD